MCVYCCYHAEKEDDEDTHSVRWTVLSIRPSLLPSHKMEAEAFAIFDEEIERTFRSVPEAALAEAGLASGTDKSVGVEHAGSVEEKHEQQHRGPVKPFDVTAKWNIARKVTAAKHWFASAFF